MSTAFQVVGSPGVLSIDMDDLQNYLRVDFDEDDEQLLRLIKSAQATIERVTNLSLAPTQIVCVNTIERPKGGVLSGPFGKGPNWYQYEEQLGANPFGASQFFFDLPASPVSVVSLIETKITIWDAWEPFAGTTFLDNTCVPSRLYFQLPVTANQWKFTYTAGYDGVNLFIREDLKQLLFALVAFWYDHREGEALPDGLQKELLGRRVGWI